MTTITRINLLLAAGVLMLGLINWFQPGLTPEAAQPITRLDINQVQELRLYRQQQLVFSLKRQAEGWQYLPPLPDHCTEQNCRIRQPELIRQWLHLAELPSLHSFPAPQNRLAEFGLDKPTYELQLDELTILIGRLDPGSQLRYVLVNERIHLISDSYYHTLEQTP